MDKVNELVKQLKEAAEAYYQGTGGTMTDAEYDLKVEYLESLVVSGRIQATEEINAIINSVSAGTKASGDAIKHDAPMLSLGKAKNEEELKSYHKKVIENGGTGFRLEMKLDGLALSAKYVSSNNELAKLNQLATRGDGFAGESLNHLILNKELKIKGLPETSDSNKDFELRGEIYITDEQFAKINANRKAATGEEFSNSRNAISGIVKRAEKGLGYEAEVSFAAYSAYVSGKQVEISKVISDPKNYLLAKDLTEKVVSGLNSKEFPLKSAIVNSKDFADLLEAVSVFGRMRETFSTPTDGVVIKPLNEIEVLDKMGYTSHHPIAYIAYKYPGEKAFSEVLDIVISVGKTGRLTPKAIITPTAVGGVVVSNVTCHNFSWLKEKGVKVGAKILITRANDVIPAVDSVVVPGDGKELEVPKVCPECGKKVEGKGVPEKTTGVHKTLNCVNENCPSRTLFYIKSIVGRTFLDIDGLGDVALSSLVEQGVISGIVDLYSLDEKILAKIVTGKTSTGNEKTLGAGNAKNIMESLRNSKENTESYKLLAALNIPSLGKSASKKLIEKFGGIQAVLDLSPEKIGEVEGVGPTLVASFAEHKDRAKAQLEDLIKIGVKINETKKDSNMESKGSFSISGSIEGFSNRDEFVSHMESLGWEYHKSPKKDTNVLFGNPEDKSSKIVKAKKNGTRIVAKLEDL